MFGSHLERAVQSLTGLCVCSGSRKIDACGGVGGGGGGLIQAI